MFRTLACTIALLSLASLLAQTAAPDANTPSTTLQINSRAVLVDVVVTDKSGKPVTGLKQDAFTVTEQGKPQTIGYFEEHTGAPGAPKEMPKLPPDVFSNFSPFAQPAAVNVLLLDSLNTRIGSQTVVHQQAMKFLKNLNPGSRMAVFTMGKGLHFIQGFTDDPALLFAALGNKKNNEVQSSDMLKGQEETNAQANLVGMMSAQVGGGSGSTAANPGMIEGLKEFIQESDTSQETDRALLTLANLQRLATFLNGFPGRKNVIWFAESPAVARRVDQQIEQEWQKTQNMLAAARVALYPVDARGVETVGFYQADSVLPASISSPSQIIGNPSTVAGSATSGSSAASTTSTSGGATGGSGSIAGQSPGSGGFSSSGAQSQMLMDEAGERDAEQSMMKEIAEDTGGKAFMNTNGLSQVMAKITADSADFYTLSYAPTDAKMDGTFRKIVVKVADGNFNVSYRRGYYARETGLPGGEMRLRAQAVNKLAAENAGAVDPLLPFMDLGMPQSEQILYTAKIQPMAAKADAGAAEQGKAKVGGQSYTVDFSIVLKDLDLKLDSDGVHKGMLNVSLLAYDKYGKVASRKEHVVALNIKPDVYAVYAQSGLPMHTEFEVPKGQHWLRTGVYDEGSRKVGTMEIALDSVVPLAAYVPLTGSTKVDAILPARKDEKVTVEQLERAVAAVHGKKDQDVAKRLSGMELSERLNSEKLAKMEAELPGEKSRMALLVMADASVFLQLPTMEIPAVGPPDLDTQRLILSKAAQNVIASIHKFPDFFAQQTTNRFHDLKLSFFQSNDDPVILERQPFQPLDSFTNTVYYRNGQEVVDTTEGPRQDKPIPKDGLVNWGVFGPLQRIVMTDIYKGKIGWGHWEQRASGPVAVFRYAVPKEKSDYVVKYCCLGFPNGQQRETQSVPAFHGEIAIDAETGAVYRVVIFTDLLPGDSIFRADIMVEYEPVEIGGKMYICPRKSVSITTAVAPQFRTVCAGGVGVMESDCTAAFRATPKDTAINDTAYDSYHVFGSEVRIVPEGDAGQGNKTAPDGAAPPVPQQ
ncbi:MAG: VWA domain-containing protein [Terracidiphilus sp.]|jgi:VWFA-related protein